MFFLFNTFRGKNQKIYLFFGVDYSIDNKFQKIEKTVLLSLFFFFEFILEINDSNKNKELIHMF